MQKKKIDPEFIPKRAQHMVHDHAFRKASGFAPDFAKAAADKKAAPDKQDEWFKEMIDLDMVKPRPYPPPL